jgi:outer membrane lipoprotein carrier protein
MTASKIALVHAGVLFTFLLIGQFAGPTLDTIFAAANPESPFPSLSTVLDRLQQHYQETKSFRAKFDQTFTRPGLPALQRSGNIYYKKPGKLRWEFQGSQPEIIVSDGKTIYDYDPGLNQVVETPLAQAVRSQAAAAFLLGAGDLKRDFTAQGMSGPEANGLVRVSLIPKHGGERIGAGIDRKTYNITTLSIADAMGNRTDFSFSNIELNPPLQDSQFTFKPPDGADIVSAGNAR